MYSDVLVVFISWFVRDLTSGVAYGNENWYIEAVILVRKAFR